jgi:ABC-type transporter Mla MlaB component
VNLPVQHGRIDGKNWLQSVSRGYGSSVESEEDEIRVGRLGNELLRSVSTAGQVMLKISGTSVPGKATLRLAGRLGGEWVGELKKAYELARAEHGHVALDFGDVIFVDRAGAALIRSLVAEGISLINCSPFITEQLKQPSPEKDGGSGNS